MADTGRGEGKVTSGVGRGGAGANISAFMAAARLGAGPFSLRRLNQTMTRGEDGSTPTRGGSPALEDQLVRRGPSSFYPDAAGVDVRLANPTAGNTATPNLIKGTGVICGDLNTVRINSSEWFPVTIDRPEIWVPRVAASAPIWYTPNRQGLVLGSTEELLKSTKYGVVYLSSPGTWWIHNTDLPPGKAIEMMRIDAWQPGVVSKYLSDPGVHAANTSQVSDISNAGVVSTAIGANRDRVGLTLQNNTRTALGVAESALNGTIALRMSRDVTNATLDPVAGIPFTGITVPFGILLAPGATMTFAGDNNCKQALRVVGMWNAAPQVVTTLTMMEYV